MQLEVSLFEKDIFEMDASGLKKLNVRHLHYIYPLWLGIYGHQSAETGKWHMASMLADTMFPPNLTASGLQETLFSWLPWYHNFLFSMPQHSSEPQIPSTAYLALTISYLIIT